MLQVRFEPRPSSAVISYCWALTPYAIRTSEELRILAIHTIVSLSIFAVHNTWRPATRLANFYWSCRRALEDQRKEF